MKKHLAALLIFTSLSCFASGSVSNRVARPFGVRLGLLGDPYPTLIGINVDYSLFDFARVTAGFGYTTVSGTSGSGTWSLKATTLGAGVRFLVPGWNLTPIAGISYANVGITASGSSGGQTINGLTASNSLFYLSGGIDWTASSGFHVGAGYNMSLLAGVTGLPYVSLGFFF